MAGQTLVNISIVNLVSIVVLVMIGVGIAAWRGHLEERLQLVFLLRFQLIMLFSPLIITFFSLFRLGGVLGNLMTLEKMHEGFIVALIGFGSAWYSLALTNIVLDRCGERFLVGRFVLTSDNVEHFERFRAPKWLQDWSGALFAVPPMVLAARVYFVSPGRVTIGMILGALVAAVIALMIDAATLLCEPKDGPTTRFIFMSSSYLEPLATFLRKHDPLRNLRVRWLSCLGPGYVNANGRPHADQITSMLAFLVIVMLYTASFWWGSYRLQSGHGQTGIPALAYLEFLIASVGVILAGAAFWLDRYRVSVVLAVAMYSLLVSNLVDTDHYWPAWPPNPGKTSDTRVASEYTDGISAWLKYYENSNDILRIEGAPVVVVVCASGGGIQAAAWTSKVLTELQKELGKPFARSIRLISSTSGGSVGSLFFVQSFFSAKDAPNSAQLDNINLAATTGSLDASGWGIVNPDLARLFAPWILPLWSGLSKDSDGLIDRGWALEQSWRVALKDPTAGNSIHSRISDWRKLVAKGILPGTVFNATMVESGQPLLISTLKLPVTDSRNADGTQGSPRAFLFGQTPDDSGADLYNVTAARLSATFPYVSPVARGRYKGGSRCYFEPANGNHIADGGYYDNFGVSAAIEWINDIARHYGPCGSGAIKKIVIIQIEALPEKDPAPLLDPTGGWTSEILGPVKTVLDATSATQLGRDALELGLLDNFNRSGTPFSNSACPNFITSFKFVAPNGGPLSWQLSDEEKCAINHDWEVEKGKVLESLRTCLNL